MKIKEIATITGLTEKTIRFYEEKGLILPEIHMVGNRKFREYTGENLKELKEIANLRKLYFTIEEIKTMKENPSSIQQIITDYKKRIEEEIKVKLQIADSLQVMELSNKETLDSVIRKIKAEVNIVKLLPEELNSDFKSLDRKNSNLDSLVGQKIFTKHGLFAKTITAVDVLIMKAVNDAGEINYYDIQHVCAKRGITNQEYVGKVLGKLCHKRLVVLKDGMYHLELDKQILSKVEADRLMQGVVIGSPDVFVYAPQSPLSVSAAGYSGI